jgi:glycosyltransferase involved in cell wall biosynthesis
MAQQLVRTSRWKPASLSVVVPVYNEEGNAAPLVRRIALAARPCGLPLQIVIVDDGSSDSTLSVLRDLCAEVPELEVVALRRNFGQTLALQAGFDRAHGDAIVTMDGDLQNDPNDIPRLLAALEEGADVVSGWRKERKDTLILRKVPSWIANRLIRLVTRIEIHDQGCALKAYRSEVVRSLDLYADMHRFIAVLTLGLGATIAEIEVAHHARMSGTSKYGISRTLRVLADLFTIQMITRFRERPLRWFTTLGVPFLLASLLAAGVALAVPESSVIGSAIALVTGTTFVSCLLLGLLAEFVTAAAIGASGPRGARARVGV